MTSSQTPTRAEEALRPHVQRWTRTWTCFNEALHSATQPFDSWVWIYRLGTGMTDYLYHATHLNRFDRLGRLWRPATPAIAVFLILLSLTSYFASLRTDLVRQRWCPSKHAPCAWEYVHTSIVVYLGIMVLYNYVSVIFQSPGVLLSPNPPHAWRAMDSQGGFLGWNAALNVPAEQGRAALYGGMAQLQACHDNDDDDSVYPQVHFTFCNKCEHWRPPRCHHCSTCNRCILQMDHHCPWVNNCIGYNNTRTFFLALTYLMVGCWYGSALTGVPFYEEIKQRVGDRGWLLFYDNGTGFLDLPSPWSMLRLCWRGDTLSASEWIKMIFPLLFGIGFLLTVFWAFHLRYLLTAQTTLEEKVVLLRIRARTFAAIRAKRRGEEPPPLERPVNPFHQGSKWKNLRHVLGPHLLLLLLPMRPSPPPPPYMPPPKSKGV